jgi:hypothetical protein
MPHSQLASKHSALQGFSNFFVFPIIYSRKAFLHERFLFKQLREQQQIIVID